MTMLKIKKSKLTINMYIKKYLQYAFTTVDEK